MYVRPYVRMTTKRFSDFNEIWLCRRRSMSDARRYAIWPDPRWRLRSWGFWSSENCTFPSLSPPPFTMWAGKWPLILITTAHYLNFFRPDLWFLSYFLCHVTLNLEGSLRLVRPQKSFSDFNEIWHLDRGRWVMHDGMPYDPIQGQGQGHECLKATQEESTVSPARE